MKFGEKLRVLRKEKKVTQRAVAELIDVSLKTVRNYEGGRSYPKQRETYYSLADFFGVDVNYLLTEDEGENPGLELGSELNLEKLTDCLKLLFEGDKLSLDEKGSLFATIQDAYIESIVQDRVRDKNGL